MDQQTKKAMNRAAKIIGSVQDSLDDLREILEEVPYSDLAELVDDIGESVLYLSNGIDSVLSKGEDDEEDSISLHDL